MNRISRLFGRVLWLMSVAYVASVVGCTTGSEPPTPEVRTTPLFNPLSSPVQVPTPTDLIRDQKTGMLQVPISQDDPKAQQSFNAYLNTLNGYPTTATAEVRFSKPLKDDTVGPANIKVYDITYSWPTAVDGLTFENLKETYKDADGKDQERGLVRIFNPTGWQRGRTYAVFVIGGSSGVKDSDDKPLGRPPLLQLVLGGDALCEWDTTKTANAESGACEATAEGATPAGCCVQVSSGDLLAQASAQEQLLAPSADSLAPEFREKSLSRALKMGNTLEKIRRGYNQFLSLALVAGLEPNNVVMVWNFSIASANEAIFDPTGSPPQIPLPSDLLKDSKSGLVSLPITAATGDAEKAFIEYLNTLDGYSLSANRATLDFMKPVVPKSVEQGMMAFSFDGAKATQLTDATVSYDQATSRATIALKAPLARGTTYIMVAVGGAKGIQNEDQSSTPSPRRSAMMQLVLSDAPLCTCKGKQCDLRKGESCDQVAVSSFINDPKSNKDALTGLQKAMLFEGVRQQYAALRQAVVATGKVNAADIIALWSFSTTSLAELTFDPTSGVIPFPNDLLRDPATGKVNIPAQPGESDAEKQLRQGLNTLDGFTTLGSYYVTYSGKLDKSSVKLGESVLIFDLTAGTPSTDWKLEVVESAPAIVATPTKPLKEKNQYAIVMLSRWKTGSQTPDGGLKDDQGRRIAAAPFMALLRSPHALLNDGKSAVSLLDDATAAQAEPARKAHEPLFKTLDAQKIDRRDIVAAWTFTTQTITTPMTQLRALPWQALTTLDSNKPQWEGTMVPAPSNFPPGIPNVAIGNWVPDGTFTTWMALDEAGTGAFLADPTQGKPVKVPFMLALPKSSPPQGGYPVVVFLHGITRIKEDFLAIANTLAGAGFATLSFDLVYHGARSRCTTDAHCDGGTCGAGGICSSGKFADANKDGVPDASGAYFLRTDNPFATRDNFRQAVIDAAAALRSITLGAFTGVKSAPPDSKPGVVQLNPGQIHLLGISLGSILGANLLATSSIPKRSVLNVPGAPLTDIMFTSPRFQPEKDAILKAQGITEGSLDYLRLTTTFQWIIDPADAANFARYIRQESLPDLVSKKDVTPKSLMVMLAGQDQTIPYPLGQFLAGLIGVADEDLQKTTYPKAGHSFTLQPDPMGTLSATLAAQKQVAAYLAQGQICTPDTDKGECQ